MQPLRQFGPDRGGVVTATANVTGAITAIDRPSHLTVDAGPATGASSACFPGTVDMITPPVRPALGPDGAQPACGHTAGSTMPTAGDVVQAIGPESVVAGVPAGGWQDRLL